MTVYVALNLESYVLYEDTEVGLWCDDCLKPSVIAVPSIIVNAKTMGLIDRALIKVCQDCERSWYDKENP